MHGAIDSVEMCNAPAQRGLSDFDIAADRDQRRMRLGAAQPLQLDRKARESFVPGIETGEPMEQPQPPQLLAGAPPLGAVVGDLVSLGDPGVLIAERTILDNGV